MEVPRNPSGPQISIGTYRREISTPVINTAIAIFFREVITASKCPSAIRNKVFVTIRCEERSLQPFFIAGGRIAFYHIPFIRYPQVGRGKQGELQRVQTSDGPGARFG